nr:MAG TPA: hypothetical protein [Bacteriophage sp.]
MAKSSKILAGAMITCSGEYPGSMCRQCSMMHQG